MNRLLIVLLALAVVSCGQSGRLSASPDGARSAAGFEVEVLDATQDVADGLAGLQLSVSLETATHIMLDISARGADDLKGVYFRLRFDPQRYRPMTVEPAPGFADPQQRISLLHYSASGEIEYGQVMLRPDYRVGVSGDALLAQISLRKAPALNPRSISAADNSSRTPLLDLGFTGTDRLAWSYALRGDCDQNGEVGIADLTPISQHYKETSPGGAGTPFPFASALSQIDGDGNGEINAADLGEISKNFRRNVLGGFKVYRSADHLDVPGNATAPNGAGAVEIATAFTSIESATNYDLRHAERLVFAADLGAPISSDFYWVRPFDAEGYAGVATEHHTASVDFPVSLTPSTPPQGGIGTLADPFMLDVSQTYTFTLLDAPGGSDISQHPATAFLVEPAAAGDFSGNTLSIAATFSGGFAIEPTFNGLPLGEELYAMAFGERQGLLIAADPIDADWQGVTGNGESEPTKYILRTADFNSDYETEFSLIATDRGGALANSDLDWDCFPPFCVADPAAFTADATAGTFKVWSFTSGYLFAQNSVLERSNDIYIASSSLPPG